MYAAYLKKKKGHFKAAAVLLGFGRGVTSFPRQVSRGRRHQAIARRKWPYADPSLRRYDGASPLILSIARADALCTVVVLMAYGLDQWAYQQFTRAVGSSSGAGAGAGGSGAGAGAGGSGGAGGAGANINNNSAGGLRRRDLLRPTEVAALLLTFPGRDPPPVRE
jgi:hypothetical protein